MPYQSIHRKAWKWLPPFLGRERNKSRLLQWHSWAKDLGASDIKALGMCGDIPVWAGGESSLVLDPEPHRTFPGMENAWDGDSRERQFPRDDCLLLIVTGTKTLFAVPVLPRTGGMAFLAGLLAYRIECVVLASSKRDQCISSRLCAEDGYPRRFPARIPRTAEKCRLSGDGVRVVPLGHPKVGTSQTSGFVFRKALPRCEQRASKEPPEYVPRSGWQRPFGGHSQCLPRPAETSERGRWDVPWVGELLALAPSFPVLPLYIFQLTGGLHFGKCHLHFLFRHVQVKVLLPVLTDVRAGAFLAIVGGCRLPTI